MTPSPSPPPAIDREARWIEKDAGQWWLVGPGDAHMATARKNGTWHTWDVDGVGGENAESKYGLWGARSEAEGAIVSQARKNPKQWHHARLVVGRFDAPPAEREAERKVIGGAVSHLTEAEIRADERTRFWKDVSAVIRSGVVPLHWNADEETPDGK